MWRSIDHASISDSEYDTFLLHDTICGHEMGGERVPTRLWQYDTYDFQAGYEIETFAPIVAYGSLESVRSAHLAGSAPCYEGFAPEDVALQLHCKGLDSSAVAQRSIHLRRDAISRRTQAPMATHRRYCDPQRRITVEDALARPRAFTEALYDSSLKRAQHLDNLVVPAAKRGEEDFDKRRSTLSLKGWVYITSSADASIRPGMHQLIDLPVFSSAGCADLPEVACSESRTLNQGDAALLAHERRVDWHQGREMLALVRCSLTIAVHFGYVMQCRHTPYGAAVVPLSADPLRQCFQGDLVLKVESYANYPASHWMAAMNAPPPRPSAPGLAPRGILRRRAGADLLVSESARCAVPGQEGPNGS